MPLPFTRGDNYEIATYNGELFFLNLLLQNSSSVKQLTDFNQTNGTKHFKEKKFHVSTNNSLLKK